MALLPRMALLLAVMVLLALLPDVMGLHGTTAWVARLALLVLGAGWTLWRPGTMLRWWCVRICAPVT